MKAIAPRLHSTSKAKLLDHSLCVFLEKKLDFSPFSSGTGIKPFGLNLKRPERLSGPFQRVLGYQLGYRLVQSIRLLG